MRKALGLARMPWATSRGESGFLASSGSGFHHHVLSKGQEQHNPILDAAFSLESSKLGTPVTKSWQEGNPHVPGSAPRAYSAERGVFPFLSRAFLIPLPFSTLLSGDRSVKKPTSKHPLNRHTLRASPFRLGSFLFRSIRMVNSSAFSTRETFVCPKDLNQTGAARPPSILFRFWPRLPGSSPA